jgi:uncharacterized protein
MVRDILAYKCRKCGQLHYPYRMRCKKCGHVEFVGADVVFDTEPLPKDGKLLTFTNVYALPSDFEAVSLSLGIVELSNGMRILGQLRCESPKTGMKVRGNVEVVRSDQYNKFYGMVFYPA